MPVYMKGNMMSMVSQYDWFCITTNAFIKRNGALVMGAGIAKQVRDSYPGIDVVIGRAVRHWADRDNVYGFIEAMEGLGLFQVKNFFKDNADLNLIKLSTSQMNVHARSNPGKSYALNFPGIGNGKLKYDDVKPIIDVLPENVHIWTFN